MSGTTLQNGYVKGVTLSNPAAENPVSIAAGANVEYPGSIALYIPTYTPAPNWTITNSGTVQSVGSTSGSYGIVLLGGGTITNASSSALIAGFNFGVYMQTAGLVVNDGIIDGTDPMHGIGVVLNAGANLTNAVTGTIDGGSNAVFEDGTGPNSAVNQGHVSATHGAGIDLAGSGYAYNASTGTIVATNSAAPGGDYYGVLLRGTGTVTNAGSISAVAQSTSAYFTQNGYSYKVLATGIFSDGAAYVLNEGTGRITTSYFGVRIYAGTGTVTNFGSIGSTHTYHGAGVAIGGRSHTVGGTVTNEQGAHISGEWIGVQFYGAGTVINQGSIYASNFVNAGAGVWIKGQALVSNAATGTIAGGPFGLVLYNQSTVINQGVINGSEYAVDMFAGFADRLIVAPGATFSGVVSGGNTVGSTVASVLELTSGATTGTISGLGTVATTAGILGSKYFGFSQITLDPGAAWSLGGTIAAGQSVDLAGSGDRLTLANPTAMNGTIDGALASDSIVLDGVSDATSATLNGSNLLTVARSGNAPLTLQFNPAQTFASTTFGVTVSGGNTTLSIPCFAAGTRIRTTSGDIAVEALHVGDEVPTLFGASAAIRWLGHRRVDCARHPRPHDVWPVRVQRGAFGQDTPLRDLWLSPDHAVCIDGVLIPVRYLINGASIAQIERDAVTYWHVELDRHDVILAEGLPAETYLDTGNRAAFTGGDTALMLHPDFARRTWARHGCAPLVLDGPRVAAARQLLFAQAERLGHACTGTADIQVIADGKSLPAFVDGAAWSIRLPPGTASVRLRSRSWVPAHMQPHQADHRTLGIAVARIRLDERPVPLDDLRLFSGWHAVEPEWRWTDGDAGLTLAGIRSLCFSLAATGTYWLPRKAA